MAKTEEKEAVIDPEPQEDLVENSGNDLDIEDDDGPLEGGGIVIQRAVNRGSRRRIENAKANFSTAFDNFVKEIDIQFFEADEAGNRIAPWGFVEHLSNVKRAIFQEIDLAMADNLEAVQELEAETKPKEVDVRTQRVAKARSRRASAVPGNQGGGTEPADPEKNQ